MYYVVYKNGTKEGPYDWDGAVARLKAVHHTATTRKDKDDAEYYEPGKDEPVAKIVAMDDIESEPKTEPRA